jgi:hypothetical protein
MSVEKDFYFEVFKGNKKFSYMKLLSLAAKDTKTKTILHVRRNNERITTSVGDGSGDCTSDL